MLTQLPSTCKVTQVQPAELVFCCNIEQEFFFVIHRQRQDRLPLFLRKDGLHALYQVPILDWLPWRSSSSKYLCEAVVCTYRLRILHHDVFQPNPSCCTSDFIYSLLIHGLRIFFSFRYNYRWLVGNCKERRSQRAIAIPLTKVLVPPATLQRATIPLVSISSPSKTFLRPSLPLLLATRLFRLSRVGIDHVTGSRCISRRCPAQHSAQRITFRCD